MKPFPLQHHGKMRHWGVCEKKIPGFHRFDMVVLATSTATGHLTTRDVFTHTESKFTIKEALAHLEHDNTFAPNATQDKVWTIRTRTCCNKVFLFQHEQGRFVKTFTGHLLENRFFVDKNIWKVTPLKTNQHDFLGFKKQQEKDLKWLHPDNPHEVVNLLTSIKQCATMSKHNWCNSALI